MLGRPKLRMREDAGGWRLRLCWRRCMGMCMWDPRGMGKDEAEAERELVFGVWCLGLGSEVGTSPNVVLRTGR